MTMLTLHHLNNSRSQKIVWLLEELELDYRLECYQRDPETLLGPPELKRLHTLGKAPVLEDEGGVVLGESGAIVDYVLDRHGGGRLSIDPDDPRRARFLECLYLAISGGMNPIMIKVYCSAFGLQESAMDKAASAELETVLGYIEELLSKGEYLLGKDFTVADIQMSFIPELAAAIGCAGEHSVIGKWQQRIYARLAFHRAIARGGQYDFAAPI